MGRALADLCKFTEKKPGAGADQICLGSAALVLNAVDDADADAVVQVNVGQELLPSLLQLLATALGLAGLLAREVGSGLIWRAVLRRSLAVLQGIGPALGPQPSQR